MYISSVPSFTDLLRTLIDRDCQRGDALASACFTKIREWIPFEETSPELVQSLIKDAEDEIRPELEQGYKDMSTGWIVGAKAGSCYTGLESLGVPTVKLQLQGQRLVALASTSELLSYFRETSVKTACQRFEMMDANAELPDSWEMPRLCFEYIKTGDVVFVPAGMVIIEKTVERSVSLRPHGVAKP